MKTKQGFAKALKDLRKAKGLTQEDFSIISSRTYISSLERGLKSPTLEKIESLASTIKVHPMTLLAVTYMRSGKVKDLDELFKIIRNEIQTL